MEDNAFLMVRGADGNLDNPLNDVSMALGGSSGKLFPDHELMNEGGSDLRELPDDAAGFEEALLRGDMAQFGEQDGQTNFLVNEIYG